MNGAPGAGHRPEARPGPPARGPVAAGSGSRGGCAAWCGDCRWHRLRSSPRVCSTGCCGRGWTTSQRTLLRHRCIEIESVETAVRVRLVLGERGFEVARAGLAPVVVIRAQTAALLRLARGEDDADRLFFERRLVMEGDTEFALLLKNTLDAIGPLWAPPPR